MDEGYPKEVSGVEERPFLEPGGKRVLLAGLLRGEPPLDRSARGPLDIVGQPSELHLAAVQQAPLETERAIAEASLVAYVTDRETFDATGAEERVNHVLALSAEQAAADWTRLWSSESPDYPLKHYDLKDRIHVKVRAVTFLDNETAQIRFIKRLITQHGQERSAAFVATVAFAFEPRQERKLEDVWENPLGFQVTRYRVDSETLEGGRL